jgi:hypothetical protein
MLGQPFTNGGENIRQQVVVQVDCKFAPVRAPPHDAKQDIVCFNFDVE